MRCSDIMLTLKPVIVPVRKPCHRKVVIPRADWIHTAGHFIGLTVLFTSSMNWWYYKNKRK